MRSKLGMKAEYRSTPRARGGDLHRVTIGVMRRAVEVAGITSVSDVGSNAAN